MGTELRAAAASKAEARARVQRAHLERELLMKRAELDKAKEKAQLDQNKKLSSLPRNGSESESDSGARGTSFRAWLYAGIVSVPVLGMLGFNAVLGQETPATEVSVATESPVESEVVHQVGGTLELVSTYSMDPVLMWGGLGALAMGAGILMSVLNRKNVASTSVPTKEKPAENYTKQWAGLDARRNALMVSWSRYETDVALMIDYPVMTDYTDPVIGKVITAMQQMRNAEMLIVDKKTTPVYGSVMLSAVNKFESALTTAEKYARRYGQTKLDPREQRKLSAARSALNIILNEESPAHEVEAAYKSLRSSLVGIIDLPQQAVHALEAKVRRELTVA